jgi:CHAT domain-containing protein
MVDASLAEAAVLVPLYEGVQARAAGDADRAAARFAAALDVAQQLGAVMLQVVVLGTMHRRDDAAALIQPYLGGLPPDIAVTLLVRLHRYHEALALIEQHAPTGPERPWEPAARHAEALLGVGRPEPAAELAGEAIGHFERHLGQLSRDILRVTAGDDVTVAGLYGIAVRAHAALAVDAAAAEHTARAFEYSDRARGTSLADLIDLGGTADPGVAAAVRDWHRAGAVLARTIEEVARSTDPPREIRAMVAGAERELDAAEARLAEVAPALSGRRPLPVTPPLDRIQSWLAPGALLLHFYAYDDELIGIAVTRDTARPVRLAAPTPQLTAAVRRFHGAVSDRTSSAARRTERGQPLADLLLEPFAAELGDVERVIVVPHGNLAMLPFGVLPFGGDVLAASHQVSYLPAASLLDPRRDDDATTFDMAAPTLVVGNPAYGRERGMPALPGAEVEAVTVARLRKQEALRGPAADRAAVLGGLPTARIVHLATHGLLIEGAPYSAELALAGADSLTIPDLAGVGAAVDLAVLSACDSGRGRATSAGDVVGLTRAFLSAGVRQLVTSLWPVDDRLACLTMVGFHRELLGGRPPAAALSAAQREVRGLTAAEVDERYGDLVAGAGRDPAAEDPSRTRDIRPRHNQPPVQDVDHPFFWAPFIHVGR